MAVNTLIQLRRGSASEWLAASGILGHGILYQGEFGYETDSGRLKIGDGLTPWSNLPYSTIVPSGFVGGTGIYVVQGDNASTLTIAVTGLNSSLIQDFTTAVDSRISAAAVSAEQVLDIVGTGIAAGTGIHVVYDANNTGKIFINVSGLESTHNHDDKYYTQTQLSSSGLGAQVNWNNLTSVPSTFTPSSHTHTLSEVSDVTASAQEVNYLDGSLPGSGVAGKAVVLDANLNLVNIGNISTTGTVTVGGNLVVNGSTTTVNSNITTLTDPIITLGKDTTIDDNKDRGVEFVYVDGTQKTGFFGFDDSTGKFVFIPDATNTNEIFSGAAGTIEAKTFESVATDVPPFVVASTGLVTNLNSDLLDGAHGSYYRNFANITGVPNPVVGVNLTGDVTGSGQATLTSLGNATISINTVIDNNTVTLGTDTVGQYATTISVQGTGLTATVPNVDDGTSYTIVSNATPDNVPGTIVARDSSGNFTATNITASGFIGNGSNLTNLNASNISTGTLNLSRLPTNIPINYLTSSGITIGSTQILLGNTTTRLDNLTAISGLSAASPTRLTFCVIDGGSP